MSSADLLRGSYVTMTPENMRGAMMSKRTQYVIVLVALSLMMQGMYFPHPVLHNISTHVTRRLSSY